MAPWIDYGGTDKNTIDWFRKIDRDEFAPSLITTQPSPNRRLREIEEHAEEIWVLPDLMPAEDMPAFILDFLQSRDVQILHLMNSRLGFDLLPDITCLPEPPRIVVQLHVEEADRSGYVRYVTTRYGNLVDRFSLTSEHLANAVHEYGVPTDQTQVIYIGADAEEEFSPDRVEPVEGLADDRLHILFPARMVQQKDPLLMVEVAAALAKQDVKFQVHVLGEGELEEEVRARIAAHGLQESVLIHPPTSTPQRWYAASDVLLLTSVFEGVPAVVFEAMAIGLPVVAPALPGNTELLGEDHEGLIEPRDSVAGYVTALARLAQDRDLQAESGRQLRERAIERFSLTQMARAHEDLYREILAERPRSEPEPERPAPQRISFLDRPLYGTPLVSVIVPHYNQSAFLGECIDSIWAQTYPEIELIVVDDASTEADAKAALDELEAHDDVTVVRQAENKGPSQARNLALDHCSGRYVLPVDSDNLLLPDAVENLVEQLTTAGEDIGFIYPNLQFFGNREDYYEALPYNRYTLLHGNFCDTCSLIDRKVFAEGERYHDGIHLGHEDWEFVLRLADRGVRGEAAHGPTLRYRKWGFNRSDSVEHAPTPFEEVLEEIASFEGCERQIKSAEAPALSIACLATIPADPEARRLLNERLRAQSCIDLELIARFDGEWPDSDEVPKVRRIPTSLAPAPIDALRQSRSLMRGTFMAVTSGTSADLLADPAFVEKALRRFGASGEEIDAIAFLDVGDASRFDFRVLSPEEADGTAAHSVLWRTAAEKDLPYGLHADPAAPADSIARLFSGSGSRVEWRHAPGPQGAEPALAGPPPGWSPLGAPGSSQPRGLAVPHEPLLPGAGSYVVPRWEAVATWIPPLSSVLCRYRERNGERRIVTSGPEPEGFDAEYHLGSLRSTSLEGTARVIRAGEEFLTVPKGEWHPLPDDAEELGYVELAPFPQMDCLALAVHRGSGQKMLVALPDDPILHAVDVIETFGFIEPFPITPKKVETSDRTVGLVGLVKAVDFARRSHRYAIGELPSGELVGELGALAESELQGTVAAWIVDGKLVTERHRPPAARPSSFGAARWVLEPAAWRGVADPQLRARTFLRRSSVATTSLVRPTPGPQPTADRPAGWLFDTERPGLSPLFASYHPVTGDQLLTRAPHDAPQMGFGAPERIGFVRSIAPVTGNLEQRIFHVPWARRLGAVPRVG